MKDTGTEVRAAFRAALAGIDIDVFDMPPEHTAAPVIVFGELSQRWAGTKTANHVVCTVPLDILTFANYTEAKSIYNRIDAIANSVLLALDHSRPIATELLTFTSFYLIYFKMTNSRCYLLPTPNNKIMAVKELIFEFELQEA